MLRKSVHIEKEKRNGVLEMAAQKALREDGRFMLQQVTTIRIDGLILNM